MLNVTSGLSVTLICVTGISRPAATIMWYIGSKWKGNGTSLTFIPSNADHDEVIYCQAYNIDPGQLVFSLKPKLFVEVIVTGVGLSNEGTIFFYEGFPQLLQCTSSPSRPIPTVRWWLENKQLTDKIINLDIMDTNKLYKRTSEISLTVERESRNKTIFCEGFISGQVTPAVSMPRPIDVLYAPDVNVRVTSSTLGNMTTILRCDVRGNPAQYTFYPWKQVWRDVVIRSDLHGVTTSNTDPAHNILLLETMSLQDMGTYICSADNMVKGMNGMVIQSGSVDLKIMGIPYIIKEKDDHFEEGMGHSINISIQYYSYPAIKDFVFQRNGTAVMNTSRTRMYLSTATAANEFYDKPVQLEVQVAHLFIQNLTMDDFDSYTLILENSLGIKVFKVQLDASVTPMKPINFYVTNIQEKQLSLRWQSGYQGRYNETFVVEISIDNRTWTNVSQVSSGNRDGWSSTIVGDLVPGSEYYLRLYAYNIHGRGAFADVQLAVRMHKVETAVGASVGISVGGAVGVGVGGVVLGLIIAVISFTIRRRINGLKRSCFKSKGRTDDEMHTYSNTEMNPQTVKPIYEELNRGNAEQSVYDKISPL
ncbi:hypothetical protein CHS0354_025670 [Potamilus streckersoni]|uniref:Uncharacterized protein n=1 Tax=Potamilus streckersoni TaxID=2493646 RepID=A0AAE0T1B0_9BIVA|nr:hypothetical protein CHS0354_025670 [Potamilus streckersoni]